MALIRKLENVELEHASPHTEVEGTFSIIVDEQGCKYLQVDTYGSKDRQIVGKKSQSIRFAPEAIRQLKAILADNGL